jgi:plastocyanin
MKRIAILFVALAAMGAGCWSSEPASVPTNPPAQQPSMNPGETNPAMMGNPQATAPAPTPAPENPAMMPSPSPTPEPVMPKPENPAMKPVEKEVYATVEMSQNGFKPAQLTIKKNTIVRFKNVGGTEMWPASAPHPTHTDYQDFDARRMVKPGETYEFRFKNVGGWGYHDHMSPGLTGRIIVEE